MTSCTKTLLNMKKNGKIVVFMNLLCEKTCFVKTCFGKNVCKNVCVNEKTCSTLFLKEWCGVTRNGNSLKILCRKNSIYNLN